MPPQKETYRQRLVIELVTYEGASPDGKVPFIGKNARLSITDTAGKTITVAVLNGNKRADDVANGGAFFPRGVAEENLWAALARAPHIHPILEKPAGE